MQTDHPHRSILVPLDGSKNAENALPYAALLARLRGGTVTFMHVVDHEGMASEASLDAATEAFAAYSGHLAQSWGVKSYQASLVRSTNTAEAILHEAANADLVVIASHGRGGFHATFIGSVADKVVRGVRVPVLVVPGVGAPVPPNQEQPVLICLDGSPQSENGLAAGRQTAREMGAPVVLVRAWLVPPPASASFGEAYYLAADIVETFSSIANDYLQEVAAPGERCFVLEGQPCAAIDTVAKRIDAGLVVVGSSGKGLASRIALGSTTDRLMHSLHRPLLVIPG